MIRRRIKQTVYVEVPDEHVRPALRLAAEEVLAAVRADLELPGLRICWVMPQSRKPRALAGRFLTPINGPPGGKGCYFPDSPDEICVTTTCTLHEVGYVVVHEARHAWQHRYRSWASKEDREQERELDAMEYTRAWFWSR